MRKNRSAGNITISTTVAPEQWNKSQQYGLKWSEGLSIGLAFLIAKYEGAPEKNLNNSIQYETKIQKLAEKIQELVIEKEQLNEKLEQYNEKR